MARKPARSQRSEMSVGKQIVWVALLASWVFVVLSLVAYDAGDPPTHTVYPPNARVQNWCGPAGAFVAYHALQQFGYAAWALVAGLGIGLIAIAMRRRVDLLILRLVGVLMATAALAGLNALLLPASGPMNITGGLTGDVLSAELVARFGRVGGGLAMGVMLLVGLLVAFDRYLLVPARWLAGRAGPAARQGGAAALNAGGGLVRTLNEKRSSGVRLDDLEDDEELEETSAAMEPVASKKPKKEPKQKKPKKARGKKREPGVVAPAPEEVKIEVASRAIEPEEEEDDELPGAPQVYSEQDLREKMSKLPIRFGQKDKRVATEADLRDLQNVVELKGYQFPSLEQLEDPEENFEERLEGIVREQAEALVAALRQYKIDGDVVGVESGPVITLYHVRLAPGTRVSALETVSKDIARALKAINLRIVANQVGRDTVGIEVPNPTKEKVRLKELMSSSEAFSKMKLPLFLGKDASGEPLIADLTKMPHMLIAGTTGSGKSVCMNTIIMGFLFTKKPNELKLVLVDPKMVEMSQFKSIPHLMCPVVTEMAKAAAILEWAVGKMDERYELLAEAGCRDIAGYNEMTWEELKEAFQPQTEQEEARIPRKLPYMVFIIDELADLMMTNKEVEGSIIRIAQKARAVGIHLILATQRPQANVVTGLIKSNMPCRIAFKVASGMDSRIVLDQKGGELLLGQGDMLYLSPSSHKLMRAQATLVDDKEIRRVVRFMKEIAGPSFERQLTQMRSMSADEERLAESENNSSASLAAAQEDPLFDRAVEIVLETKRGSVSLLQRRLAIGYTRASRLIDLMGIAQIIGEHKGSVAREVMITPEQWEEIKRLGEEELARQQSGEGDAPGQQALFAGEASGAEAIRGDSRDEDERTDGAAMVEPKGMVEAPLDGHGGNTGGQATSGTGEEEPPFDVRLGLTEPVDEAEDELDEELDAEFDEESEEVDDDELVDEADEELDDELDEDDDEDAADDEEWEEEDAVEEGEEPEDEVPEDDEYEDDKDEEGEDEEGDDEEYEEEDGLDEEDWDDEDENGAEDVEDETPIDSRR